MTKKKDPSKESTLGRLSRNKSLGDVAREMGKPKLGKIMDQAEKKPPKDKK